MPFDKYKAVWVSHSSMGDFLKCPRGYYLRHMYKDPKSGRKISIATPALSLGSVVHATLENLKTMPVEERLSRDLLADFEHEWQSYAGKKGGFKTAEEETLMKARGAAMIARVIKNPGPIAEKALRLKGGGNDMPSNFILSEEDGIILCGMVDWLQYIERDDSVRILDFKTGVHEESEESLQLPIYLLLLNALQKRKVSGASYWYLERDDVPKDVELPELDESKEEVLAIARTVKEARENRELECLRGAAGCFTCRPFEAILRGEAEYIGVAGYGHDTYVL